MNDRTTTTVVRERTSTTVWDTMMINVGMYHDEGCFPATITLRRPSSLCRHGSLSMTNDCVTNLLGTVTAKDMWWAWMHIFLSLQLGTASSLMEIHGAMNTSWSTPNYPGLLRALHLGCPEEADGSKWGLEYSTLSRQKTMTAD